MSRSRSNGDIFETHLNIYAKFCKFTCLKNAERYKILAGHAETFDHCLFLKVCKMMKHIQNKNGIFESFYPMKDHDGRKGLSEDICFINTNGRTFAMSLKRNNKDIKHPRPEALATRLKLSKEKIVQYRKMINKIKNDYFTVQKCQEETFEMYVSINKVVLNLISTSKTENLTVLFNFMVGKKTDYIAVWKSNDKKSKQSSAIELYNTGIAVDKVTLLKGNVSQNNIFLTFMTNTDHTFEFKMRIHTASSQIKKKSLKYAVNIENIDHIYSKYLVS